MFNSIDRDGSGTLCSSRLLHTLYVGRGPYALLCRRVAVARAQLRGSLLWRSCAHATRVRTSAASIDRASVGREIPLRSPPPHARRSRAACAPRSIARMIPSYRSPACTHGQLLTRYRSPACTHGQLLTRYRSPACTHGQLLTRYRSPACTHGQLLTGLTSRFGSTRWPHTGFMELRELEKLLRNSIKQQPHLKPLPVHPLPKPKMGSARSSPPSKKASPKSPKAASSKSSNSKSPPKKA